MIRTALAALALAFALPIAAADRELELSLQRLDREYRELSPQLSPWQLGPLMLQPSVPESSITLRSHRIQLTPSSIEGHRGSLTLELDGEATLNVDVQLADRQSTLSDRIRILRQRLRIEGRVELELDEHGLWVTVLRLPPSVAVRIESGLGSQLTALCRPLSVVMVGLDCDAVEETLSTVRVPLPERDFRTLLPSAEIGEQERSTLRSYLSAP